MMHILLPLSQSYSNKNKIVPYEIEMKKDSKEEGLNKENNT